MIDVVTCLAVVVVYILQLFSLLFFLITPTQPQMLYEKDNGQSCSSGRTSANSIVPSSRKQRASFESVSSHPSTVVTGANDDRPKFKVGDIVTVTKKTNGTMQWSARICQVDWLDDLEEFSYRYVRIRVPIFRSHIHGVIVCLFVLFFFSFSQGPFFFF
jgi:hypothetical protein